MVAHKKGKGNRSRSPQKGQQGKNQSNSKERLLDNPILFDRRAAFARVTAEPVLPEQGWQFGHAAGAPVTVLYEVLLDGGTLGFHAPLPSELLYDASTGHLRVANRLKAQIVKSAAAPNDLYPDNKYVRDYNLVFRFFEEAMSGISLAYAALNNFANEHIPRNFQTEIRGKVQTRNDLIQRGIELRLSKVLAETTGQPNLMENVTTWNRIMRLKELRDGIEHANGGVESFKFSREVDETIFGKLLSEPNFEDFANLVREIIDSYRTGEEGPTSVDSAHGSSVTVMSARRYLEQQRD